MLQKQTQGAQAPATAATATISPAAVKTQVPRLPVGPSPGCVVWACHCQVSQSEPCPGCGGASQASADETGTPEGQEVTCPENIF